MRLPTFRPQPGITRRVVISLAVAVSAFAAPQLSHAASSSTVPSGDVAFDSNRTGNYEIYTMTAGGADQTELTKDTRYDSWWPRISPDRSEILFYRTPAGVHDRDFSKTSLWLMNADGSDLHELIPTGAHGWTQQGHAVWSPDGTHIVMFAKVGSNTNIWTTKADGSDPVQLTNRPGTSLDPSYTASGGIVFIGCPLSVCSSSQFEVYDMTASGSNVTRLTNDAARDQDPFGSPNGASIDWLRQTAAGTWAIWTMTSTGGNQHGVVPNLTINSKPAWSADGSWIYFHRLATGQTSFTIWKVHPDGTDLTAVSQSSKVGPSPYADEYPDASEF